MNEVKDRKSPIEHICSFNLTEWGGDDTEIRLKVGFSPEEVELLRDMRTQATAIRDALPWEEGSGLARDYVTGSGLSIPWAYTLQNRESSLALLERTIQSNNRFLSQYTIAQLLYTNFPLEVIIDIVKLNESMISFLEEAEESE